MNKMLNVIVIFLIPLLAKSQSDTLLFNSQYYLLQKELIKYENIRKNGGWYLIPKSKSMKKADSSSYNKVIRKRLEIEGYLSPGNDSTESVVRGLSEAINKFQKNNGLLITGTLNDATINTLNTSVQSRIRQIQKNMERWKALPPDLGRFYIFVNTADFMLKVIKNDMVVMQMRVIVGRTYRRTPIFNSKLTHIILNPSWHIPPSIIKNDILPQIKKNKGYLQEKHIKIFYYDEKQKLTEVSGDSIDWNNISMKSFPYKLIQDPGEDNALGLVKFMFANDYNVYMHDTPSKELFNDSEPTFSSGCIRLSHALDLAMILLKNNTEWPIQKIIKTIGNGKTVTISLSEPVNIYIQYFTAWVNGEGMIQFRKDIYKRD